MWFQTRVEARRTNDQIEFILFPTRDFEPCFGDLGDLVRFDTDVWLLESCQVTFTRSARWKLSVSNEM